MKAFSKSWNNSKKVAKQRKFRINSPLHTKGKFLNVHLSEDLGLKHKTRNLRVRVGDIVKVMRGVHKKKTGRVEEVDIKTQKILIAGIDRPKRDGSKTMIPIQPSNLMIIDIKSDDKRRLP